MLLNALAVELPAKELDRATRLDWVTQVYPSLRYTLSLNRSPGLIGATELRQLSGASGDGMKIGIVDDGVDAGNAFFDPSGFAFPTGFPKGNTAFTTPKVIVARSFPAFGTPESASLPFDPDSSFHGTHVAGIAAGIAGTTAPAGSDHPETAGLSGVAPRAWIGNYRVFSLPTLSGDSANTPEIIAAFEQAVLDGMDVINFSAGGPEIEPANDALVEAIENVVLAGVVPVISAGNERDDFGLGSIGSPGTAPDAITVGAATNAHVFAPALSLLAPDAPAELQAVPYQAEVGAAVPASWQEADQVVIDPGSLVGTDGQPIDRFLCAPGTDPNAPDTALEPGIVDGELVLVLRGRCGLAGKITRALEAGAVGVLMVNNRPGEPQATGRFEAPIPTLFLADLDGARLQAFLEQHGGQAPARVGVEPLELDTGRAGVLTSFSSAGPTAFRHDLKPDITAPGAQVLSSTNPIVGSGPFAVFDGTSMSAPHVAGAAALLLERHPAWEPWQVKAALVSTATTAWTDTARTRVAPVSLAGGGLADLAEADHPLVLARPALLSFGDLNVTRGAATRTLAVELSDGGGGAGTWSVEVRAQTVPGGSAVNTPTSVVVPESGTASITVSARAASGSPTGDGQGSIVLRRGDVERRIPYLFLVTRPALAGASVQELEFANEGSTSSGTSRVKAYRFPTSPFSLLTDPGDPLEENGAEDVYSLLLDRPVLNFGVAAEPLTPGAQIDTFVLGALDENTVQGFAGTPTNVNSQTFGYLLPVGAAGASFPTAGRYFVAIDSGDDPAGRSLGGRYRLHAWVDDFSPPFVDLETQRRASRRGLIVVRALDDGAGVDPLSLAIAYEGIAIGASSYDQQTGLALFPIPRDAPPLHAGRNTLLLVAADYQEAKNVVGLSSDPLPNTALRDVTVTVVPGKPVVSWLEPEAGFCSLRSTTLLISAEGPRPIQFVRFYDGDRLLATDRTAESSSLFGAAVTLGPGERHRLRADAIDASGAAASAARNVSLCG